MFNEGTERPFTSELLKEKRKGFYHCAYCGKLNYFPQRLNSIAALVGHHLVKLYQGLLKQNVDYSFGMKRIEYHCAKCGVHHGHVFDDGPSSTGKRFCNNGLCLLFIPVASFILFLKI